MAARVDSHTDKEKQKGIGFMKAKMRTNTEPEVTTDISTAADMTTTVESEDDAFLLDLRELEKRIRAVKGVGEKRAEEIMQIIEQWMGV
jgi:hypothetical protein